MEKKLKIDPENLESGLDFLELYNGDGRRHHAKLIILGEATWEDWNSGVMEWESGPVILGKMSPEMQKLYEKAKKGADRRWEKFKEDITVPKITSKD